MLPHTSPRSHDDGDPGAQGGRGTGLGECFLGAPLFHHGRGSWERGFRFLKRQRLLAFALGRWGIWN